MVNKKRFSWEERTVKFGENIIKPVFTSLRPDMTTWQVKTRRKWKIVLFSEYRNFQL